VFWEDDWRERERIFECDWMGTVNDLSFLSELRVRKRYYDIIFHVGILSEFPFHFSILMTYDSTVST
jgi:hypothetical protein